MAQRPILELESSPRLQLFQILGALGVLALVVLTLSIPTDAGKIPTHFGTDGKPDRWGSPFEAWILVVVGVVTWGGLMALNRKPHWFNFPFEITPQNARRQYQLAREMMAFVGLMVVWLFAYIAWIQLRAASGEPQELGLVFLLILLPGFMVPLVIWLVAASRPDPES